MEQYLNPNLFEKLDKRKLVGGAAVAGALYYLLRSRTPEKKEVKLDDKKFGKLSKGKVNKEFLLQLRKMCQIMIPNLYSKEFLLLVLQTILPVFRTMFNLTIATYDGDLVKNIVERQPRLFFINLAKWLALAIPATYVNSLIKYIEHKLHSALRTRLTQYCYDLYMDNDTFYKVSNLDSRLTNADQSLTQDISKFSHTIARVYTSLTKPVFDIILTGIQLAHLTRVKTGSGTGFAPSFLAVMVVWLTAKLFKMLTPPFGKLAAKKAELEGNWRYCHSRLITNAEEVVFYGGEEIEKSQLYKCYTNLINHLNYVYFRRSFYNMIEDYLMKYTWNATSLVMIAIPVFTSILPGQTESNEQAVSERTGDFITVRKLLMSTAKAVEKIMMAYKDISVLAGYTARVHNMITVFEDVKAGKFQKKTLTSTLHASLPAPVVSAVDHPETGNPLLEAAAREAGENIELDENTDTDVNTDTEGSLLNSDIDTDSDSSQTNRAYNRAKARVAKATTAKLLKANSLAAPSTLASQTTTSPTAVPLTQFQLQHAFIDPSKRGKIVDGDFIRFENIPIVTPNGDVLIPRMTFEIRPGHHLLVNGPNGCGKSSIFRILGELWPVYDGVLTKPKKRGELFYIPQRVYLPLGNLRDQIIYPDTLEQMHKRGMSDRDLEKLLTHVSLNHLWEREGGWDATNDWKDVLSGGEKQRIAMARLFYHKPKYAILDECTNAVSIDVEEKMYTHAKQIGITVISITHRPSLKKYHNFLLYFDGQGGYSFSPL
eukprot:TRINITY_DN2647_c0_g1_i1.p1 TRINITY_DN2647_c0_g1~~TRINITY_DN2647_c0_g1_i1.p1  ORF type:complete len:780 (-),score=216.90 TRINITY_DN2647_c0_g1_i1:143-2449(-)